MKLKLSGNTVLQGLFLLMVFLLAFNMIHDTDAWMHLSLGKYIWNHNGLPVTEPFVYPNFSQSFSYTSWLFALGSYLTFLGFGVTGLVFLKAVLITLFFAVMLQGSLLRKSNIIVVLFFLSIGVVLTQYRFVLRPDILLMSYLAAVIFSLNAYLYEKKKYIYFLPLLLLLWANTHSSVNLIFAPFGAFIAGSIIQKYLHKKKLSNAPFLTSRQILTLLILLTVSLLVSLLNPNHLQQYIAGANFLDTAFYKQEIIELQPIVGSARGILIVIDIITILSFCLLRKRGSVIHLILVIPFLLMPFVSFRFFILTVVVAFPIFIRNICQLKIISDAKLLRGKGAALFISLWLLLVTGSALQHFGPAAFMNEGNVFGSGFSYGSMPRGAVNFMDRAGIYGRVLNPYAYGQYLIWTGYPKRTVFVDARGGLSDDLLEYSFLANGVSINKLYDRFKFNSIIKKIGSFAEDDSTLNKLNLSFKDTKNWALVYWDDNSLLYLRRGDEYAETIRHYEYKYLKPDMKANIFVSSLGDNKYRHNIIRELQRNISSRNSDRAHLLLGIVYFSSGNYRDAVPELKKVIESGFSEAAYANALAILGDVYFAMHEYTNSLKYYLIAPNHEDVPGILFNIGRIHAAQGRLENAVDFFEKVVAIDRDFLQVYPELISAYKSLGLKDEAVAVQKKYQALGSRKDARNYFEQGVIAQQQEDYPTAIGQYRKSLQVNQAAPVVWTNLGFALFDSGKADKAFSCFSKAVTLKEDFGVAYYGLALVYKKRGAIKEAIENFERYCQLEPTGYFYRNAKVIIRDLEQ